MVQTGVRRYSPSRARVPPLTTDKVTAVLPIHAVLAGGTVGVSDSASAVGPEGVVETIVGAGATGGAGTSEELGAVVEWDGDGAGDGSGHENEGFERDHDDGLVG